MGRLQGQRVVLPFTFSTPVDSQENTAILSWAMPSGNEPLGAQPRQGGDQGEEREREIWRTQLLEASRWALGKGGLGACKDWEEPLRSFQPTSVCREVSLRPRQGTGLAQGHTAGEVMELGWNHRVWGVGKVLTSAWTPLNGTTRALLEISFLDIGL